MRSIICLVGISTFRKYSCAYRVILLGELLYNWIFGVKHWSAIGLYVT